MAQLRRRPELTETNRSVLAIGAGITLVTVSPRPSAPSEPSPQQ
jgi:hypothetical protein